MTMQAMRAVRAPAGVWLGAGGALAGAALVVAAACSSSSIGESPGGDTGSPGDTRGDSGPDDTNDTGDSATGCTADPGPGDAGIPPSSGGDPTGGADKFTLAQAMAGFPPGSGTIRARIATEKGEIVCTLDDTNAPITTANFIGLARGIRPYRSGSSWKTGRFYDGLLWHRVIPNFVIQGGDPAGSGSGGPGYDLPNENHAAEPLGTLAMAAATLPSGSQFYIVVGSGPASNYNVFGNCSTIAAIALSKVDRNSADKPKVPVHMQSIAIERCPPG